MSKAVNLFSVLLFLVFSFTNIGAKGASLITKSQSKDNSCNEKFNRTSQPSNVFNPSELKVGDHFLGLKISEMKVVCKQEKYIGKVTFQGEAIVSGVYDLSYPLEDSEGICFEIALQAEKNLPRMLGDDRQPWFCFDNQEKAKKVFNGSKNAFFAKIVINDFQIIYEPKGVFNRANLVKVIDSIPIDK